MSTVCLPKPRTALRAVWLDPPVKGEHGSRGMRLGSVWGRIEITSADKALMLCAISDPELSSWVWRCLLALDCLLMSSSAAPVPCSSSSHLNHPAAAKVLRTNSSNVSLAYSFLQSLTGALSM